MADFKQQPGKFLAYHGKRRNPATGAKMFNFFPIADRAFYLANGWVEVAWDYTEDSDVPKVAPPENTDIPTEKIVKPRKLKNDE